MLDDDAYLRWLDQCGFSDPARQKRTSTRPGTRKPKRDAVGE